MVMIILGLFGASSSSTANQCEINLIDNGKQLIVKISSVDIPGLSKGKILRLIPLRRAFKSDDGITSSPPTLSIRQSLIYKKKLFILFDVGRKILVDFYTIDDGVGWKGPLEVSLISDVALVSLTEENEEVILTIRKNSGEINSVKLSDADSVLSAFDDSPSRINVSEILDPQLKKKIMQRINENRE